MSHPLKNVFLTFTLEQNDLFKVKNMTSGFDLHKKYRGHDLLAADVFDNGLLLIEYIHKI
jgi:hypothetical protein